MTDPLQIIAKDTSVIPQGVYCYRHTGKTVMANKMFVDGAWKKTDPYPVPEIQMCPYWSARDDKPDMENGYCAFLESGDWESEGLSLLWDQVKECGENEVEPEDETTDA